VLVISDYDGTLTPIVESPEAAFLAYEMGELLRALAAAPGTVVAVSSGRALDDVRARVGVDGLVYSGNHGLEIRGMGLQFVEPVAASTVPALDALCKRLEQELASVPGALVENKHLTASVHVRKVPGSRRTEVWDLVQRLVDWEGTGFRIATGNQVFEIRPPTDWNKGSAARLILDRSGAAAPATVVLGDDRTDEDAFAALPQAITARVGQGTETLARYRLDSPAEVAVVLKRLTDLRPRPPGPY
jgi:trehalose 6-phosphate phosphatase